MDCAFTSYEVTLMSCPDALIVKAGLTPFTPYYWGITNKFGTEHSGEGVTGPGGDLEINLVTSSIKPGTFNSYAGTFVLRIYGTAYLTYPLTFKGKQYDRVYLNFKDVDGDYGHLQNVVQ